MVIDHGEGVAHLPIAEWEAPLEVHLPDIIRRRVFKADVLGRLRGRQDTIVPRQDRMNRRSCRDALVLVLQTTPDLPGAPDRMGIADLQNGSLELGLTPGRRLPRTPRSVLRPILAVNANPGQPLVGRLRADAEATAQLPSVHIRLLKQQDELPSLIHE